MKIWGDRAPIQSRDGPDGSGGGGGGCGTGRREAFWLDLHVRYLSTAA